jgi:hypothetical protein
MRLLIVFLPDSAHITRHLLEVPQHWDDFAQVLAELVDFGDDRHVDLFTAEGFEVGLVPGDYLAGQGFAVGGQGFLEVGGGAADEDLRLLGITGKCT